MALLKDPLQRVGTGFGFLFVSALLPGILLALMGIGFVVLIVTRGFGGRWGEAEVFAAGLAVLIVIPITSYLLGVIGLFLCLATVPQARTGEIVLVVAVLEILIILLTASRYFAYWWPVLVSWQETIDNVTMFLFLVEKVLFVWFVRRLASYLDRGDVARLILSAALGFVVAALIAIGAYALRASGSLKTGGNLVIATFIALILGGIVVLIMAYVRYLSCLLRLRRAIRQPV